MEIKFLFIFVSQNMGSKVRVLHTNDQDASAWPSGGDANMNIRLSLKCNSDSSSAHKHELIPDGVSNVIQMHPNQSACDGITDFALEKSGPL